MDLINEQWKRRLFGSVNEESEVGLSYLKSQHPSNDKLVTVISAQVSDAFALMLANQDNLVEFKNSAKAFIRKALGAELADRVGDLSVETEWRKDVVHYYITIPIRIAVAVENPTHYMKNGKHVADEKWTFKDVEMRIHKWVSTENQDEPKFFR